jgi:hypothetical protein
MAKPKDTTKPLTLFDLLPVTKRTCIDCKKPLARKGKSKRCHACAVRVRYVTIHGHPAVLIIAHCSVCGKEFQDYASNRQHAKMGLSLCSEGCRAVAVGVHNSISRGGDGLVRSKPEKDALDYRKHAEDRRTKRKVFYQENRQRILEKLREKSRVLKQEVVNAYGGQCRCCGEIHLEFLTIDHTNGDGAAHRKQTGKGRRIYVDLKRQGFPQEGYQLLCFNCNIALGFYGYCPHKPLEKRQINHVPRVPGRRRTVA